MRIILLGIAVYAYVKNEQKKELERNLKDFFTKTKDQKVTGHLNDTENKSKWCTILTNYLGGKYYISKFEYELPVSWLKIKEFIFRRLDKAYPNWNKQSERDEENHVVSREFTVYKSKKFHIKVKTKLHNPPHIKIDGSLLRPCHTIDQIFIYSLS